MEEQSPLAVTLKSGKVYVGRIFACTNPAFSVESISMALIRSGFRKAETHELYLNVDYEDAAHQSVRHRIMEQYSKLIADTLKDMRHQDKQKDKRALADSIFNKIYGKIDVEAEEIPFSVIIMAREIQSMAQFDIDFFDSHFNSSEKNNEVAAYR